jgi:hypothetical protein
MSRPTGNKRRTYTVVTLSNEVEEQARPLEREILLFNL